MCNSVYSSIKSFTCILALNKGFHVFPERNSFCLLTLHVRDLYIYLGSEEGKTRAQTSPLLAKSKEKVSGDGICLEACVSNMYKHLVR